MTVELVAAALSFRGHALTCAAFALLAGCSGPQPPIGAPGAVPQTRVIATHTQHGESWISRAAKRGSLLYASDSQQSKVYVLSYPDGSLVGTLTGFQNPVGECVDKLGDIWIVNSTPPELIEYAHGGTTALATLADPGQEPNGCSVDPTTGNLALTNLGGSVYVYADAQGSPTAYSDSSVSSFWYCAYDGSGDLFVTGQSNSFNLIAELAKGGKTLTNVTLNQAIDAGSIQWDGSELAIYDMAGGAREPVSIDRVRVEGSTATVTGATHLKNRKDRRPGGAIQFWIKGSTIVGPGSALRDVRSVVGFWKYPKGGTATKQVRISGATGLWGTVVSTAP